MGDLWKDFFFFHIGISIWHGINCMGFYIQECGDFMVSYEVSSMNTKLSGYGMKYEWMPMGPRTQRQQINRQFERVLTPYQIAYTTIFYREFYGRVLTSANFEKTKILEMCHEPATLLNSTDSNVVAPQQYDVPSLITENDRPKLKKNR